MGTQSRSIHRLLRLNGQWQFNIFGGLMESFDADKSTDSIGWDGIFGAQLIRNFDNQSTVKFGYKHQSAHRGDKFIERTGRNRIDYTRQEWNALIEYYLNNIFRNYIELGWAMSLRNSKLQGPGRLEIGTEYGVPDNREGVRETERSGWFAALDLEIMEERDWQVDSSVHLGWFFLKNSRLRRIGLEVRNGRSPYGEFFNRDETYWGLSVWNDIY